MNGKDIPEPVIGSAPAVRRWLALGAAGVSILVVAMTLTVVLMIRMPDDRLNRLSDAGQSFGIFSTLFSAAALIGVVLSVAYQSRQNQRYDYESWHTAHAELLSRIIDEPATFAPCIGDAAAFASEEELRRYYFTTLWLNFGQIGLRSGNMSERSIRDELCAEMFQSAVARDLWVRRRNTLTAAYGGLSPYFRMVDEEFEKAVARAAVSTPSPIDAPHIAIPPDGRPAPG